MKVLLNYIQAETALATVQGFALELVHRLVLDFVEDPGLEAAAEDVKTVVLVAQAVHIHVLAATEDVLDVVLAVEADVLPVMVDAMAVLVVLVVVAALDVVTAVEEDVLAVMVKQLAVLAQVA